MLKVLFNLRNSLTYQYIFQYYNWLCIFQKIDHNNLTYYSELKIKDYRKCEILDDLGNNEEFLVFAHNE